MRLVGITVARPGTLRGLGTELLRHFRGEDVVARWGGDEFVVGMFGMSGADGRRRMGDLIETIRDRSFEGVSITISAGLAQYPSDGDDVDSLYRAADHALYEAKSEGRDRVAGASPSAARGGRCCGTWPLRRSG